jgi:ribonuclease P protein component
MSGTSESEASGAGLRLTRRMRLRRSNAFREAFGGRQLVGRHMVLWVRTGDGADARLGVIASKRTFPQAVMRNRAKRLLREAFRLERHQLSRSADLVIVGRRRLLSVQTDEVRREFVWLLGKAGLRTTSTVSGRGDE